MSIDHRSPSWLLPKSRTPTVNPLSNPLQIWEVVFINLWLLPTIRGVADLGMGNILLGAARAPAPKKNWNGDICAIRFVSLISHQSRQWISSTSPCGSINLVRVVTLILFYELGRSHSEVRDREGVGVGWPQVSHWKPEVGEAGESFKWRTSNFVQY